MLKEWPLTIALLLIIVICLQFGVSGFIWMTLGLIVGIGLDTFVWPKRTAIIDQLLMRQSKSEE